MYRGKLRAALDRCALGQHGEYAHQGDGMEGVPVVRSDVLTRVRASLASDQR
jgi:hypothetical protein